MQKENQPSGGFGLELFDFSPAAFGCNMTAEEQQENFERTVLHDTIKTKYAEDNNISLLRIRYDENVYEKLSEWFMTNLQSS